MIHVHDKERLAGWIESCQEEMNGFLKTLVQFPSDNPPGDCYPMAIYLQNHLNHLGFENVSLLKVDDQAVKQAGMISLANIVSSTVFGEGKGANIALNAHGDVVPPGLGWSFAPYGGEIANGRMYGRGAAVSKSDIAAYTYALMALKNASIHSSLNGKVDLAFTFDEETGGELGPKWLLDHDHLCPDMAIVAGFTYAAGNAHNGCLHFELKVTGKSAHAAFPHTGADALEGMTRILTALYQYRQSLESIKSAIPGIGYPTLVVGLIKGGINTNVVPDECVIRIDRRVIPEEDAEQAEKELRAVVEKTTENDKELSIEWKKILHADRFGPVAAETRLIQTLNRNWQSIMEAEGELPLTGVPLYTDARHFFAKNIPTVMFGAGPMHLEEANGHRADENIKLADVLKAAKIIACTLYDLLTENGGPPGSGLKSLHL